LEEFLKASVDQESDFISDQHSRASNAGDASWSILDVRSALAANQPRGLIRLGPHDETGGLEALEPLPKRNNLRALSAEEHAFIILTSR